MDYQEKMRVFAVGLATGALASIFFGASIQAYKVREAREEGRLEATSKLVAMTDAVLNKTKKEIDLRSEEITSKQKLTREEKISYLRASIDSTTQIEIARRQIAKDAEGYLTEKKPTTSYLANINYTSEQ